MVMLAGFSITSLGFSTRSNSVLLPPATSRSETYVYFSGGVLGVGGVNLASS